MNDPEKIVASIRYRRSPLGDVETTVWINGVYIPGVRALAGHGDGLPGTYRLELEIACDEVVVVDVDADKITRLKP